MTRNDILKALGYDDNQIRMFSEQPDWMCKAEQPQMGNTNIYTCPDCKKIIMGKTEATLHRYDCGKAGNNQPVERPYDEVAMERIATDCPRVALEDVLAILEHNLHGAESDFILNHQLIGTLKNIISKIKAMKG